MYKKAISMFLIAGQMGLATGAFASSQAQVSSEQTLLETTLAITGQKLSESEIKLQLTNAVSQYESTAPAENREQRMEQAMVTLNVVSAERAHELLTRASASSERIAHSGLSGTEASNAVQAEIMTLAKNFPEGAEYSECSVGRTLIKASVIGFLGFAAAGLVTDAEIGGDQVYTGNHNAWMIYGAIGTWVGAFVGLVMTNNSCQ